MSNNDNNSSDNANRRSFLTGAGLLFAGLSMTPAAEATTYSSPNPSNLLNAIPVLIPLDAHVSIVHIADGTSIRTGELIVDTESIELNRALIQVNTAIELVDNNSQFMLGEYMSCIKKLLEINVETNSEFEKITGKMRDTVKSASQAGMMLPFDLDARELSSLRAVGESQRSKTVLASFEPEMEQLKFRFNTLKAALKNELKIVQDMQNKMRLVAPCSGVVHLMVGVGSFVPKGGIIAYIEIIK